MSLHCLTLHLESQPGLRQREQQMGWGGGWLGAGKAQRRRILPKPFRTCTMQALESAAGADWFGNAACGVL